MQGINFDQRCERHVSLAIFAKGDGGLNRLANG